jgi:hypothetical protein
MVPRRFVFLSLPNSLGINAGVVPSINRRRRHARHRVSRRFPFVPVAILAIILAGVAGVVLFRVMADHGAHSILLKWNPPLPKPGVTVASYNVFRSTQSLGPYDQIASGITGLTYTDHDIRRGVTYYYVVKAVSAAGDQSLPSGEVSAAIR